VIIKTKLEVVAIVGPAPLVREKAHRGFLNVVREEDRQVVVVAVPLQAWKAVEVIVTIAALPRTQMDMQGKLLVLLLLLPLLLLILLPPRMMYYVIDFYI